MIVKQLVARLTAEEIVGRIRSALSGADQIADPEIALTDGTISLKGVFKAGLSVPFDSVWRVELRPENCAALILDAFRAGPFGGGAIAGHVLQMLASRLSGKMDVRVDGHALVIALAPLLASFNISLAGAISRLSVTPEGLEIVVS